MTLQAKVSQRQAAVCDRSHPVFFICTILADIKETD